MLIAINHIGIAVKNLEESIITFKKIFDFGDYHLETVTDQKVRIASFKLGDVMIELTPPTDEGSPVQKFIEKRGEGIHHIAFESTDIESDLENVKNNGINLINDVPVDGAHDMKIAFLHPKTTIGVLMELCQKK